ncbi:ABC transporter permease [Streptosporangiaceae bacterium NEAU-GS5]|nr:ABC transporter permease [Streptosporangiaceae bacterium NEAU-GS5]
MTSIAISAERGIGPRLRRLGALMRHSFLLHGRDPGHLISYLVMPMILMLIFKPLFPPVHVVTGLLVMFSLLSLSIVGTVVLAERAWHTWDRLRATPARPHELVLGKAVPLLVVLAVQQAILILYGSALVGLPISAPLTGLAVVVWSITLVALGTALAGLVHSQSQLSAACNIGALSASALGGAFVPLSGWAATIAPVSPGYWAVSMLRSAVRGDAAGMLGPAAVLLAIAVLAGAIGTVRLGRGEARLRGLIGGGDPAGWDRAR